MTSGNDLVPIDEKTIPTRFYQPFGEPLSSRVPRVRIMISGNDEQARLASQPLEVFLDDNDLAQKSDQSLDLAFERAIWSPRLRTFRSMNS